MSVKKVNKQDSDLNFKLSAIDCANKKRETYKNIFNYIGIDQSLTATGVVILNSKGKYRCSTTITSTNFGIARLVDIENLINDFIRTELDNQQYIIVKEGFAYGRVNQAHQLGELTGVLTRGWYINSIPYLSVPPMTNKKFICTTVKKDKSDVRLWVYKKWGLELDTEDECDACGLAKFGYKILHYHAKTNKLKFKQYEIDCFKSFLKE